ncbi:SDR family oxidoreductase [Nocardia sp. MW-W600-9]
MRIAVIGASGRIGREIVDVLKNQGEDVVEITRSAGVDVVTGRGLADALAGADLVVDAINAETTDTAAVTAFFDTVACNVGRAAAAAGVARIALVSIIGIDDFTGGHYAGKLAQERAYQVGPVPVRILRAAQFHEFTEMMLDWTTVGDRAEVPAYRARLVSARTVAEHLADVVRTDGPAMVEIAGPEEWRLVEAVALVAARRGAPARVVEVVDTTDPDHRRQADGALLPGPAAIIAGPTFTEWLDRR